MSDLIQIEEGYTKWRMKDGKGEFLAKKSEGGAFYYLKFSDGSVMRNLATAVERLAEEVKNDAQNIPTNPSSAA